jgi:hypothetical protein
MAHSLGLRAWKTFLRQQKRGWIGLDKSGAGLLARRYIRALAYLFNLHTLLLMGVACAAVAICYEYDFRWVRRFPPALTVVYTVVSHAAPRR